MPRQTQFLLLFLLLLYLAFPTANSTIDSFYYAGVVKFGTDLFLPHHLLYNAAGYIAFRCLGLAGFVPDALAFLKIVNAFATVASLAILALILSQLKKPAKEISGWVLLAGASFGVVRFATESEVYIIPILLSLSASYFFVRYSSARKAGFLAIAGFLAAMACLFHQMHFFWWLGLLAGIVFSGRNLRFFLAFALPALIVPAAYLLVLKFDENQALTLQNLWRYVLHDFYTGTAKSDIGFDNFLFTGINLVRTFWQVHGQMLFLAKQNLLWILPALTGGGLFVWALFQKPFFAGRAQTGGSLRVIANTHFLILGLHLLFAWFAVGNAEFMVMIPFLAPLVPRVYFSPVFLQRTGIAMLIWNFCYGIFPTWKFKLSATDKLTEIVHSQPQTLFVFDDAGKVIIEHFYHYGSEPGHVISSASLRAYQKGNLSRLENRINSQLAAGLPVYTDCIKKAKVITRSSMLVKDVDGEFFSRYHAQPVDSFLTLYGYHYLHRLAPKQK